jgi:alpha-galactosidase/6-phospho-beta-glucosidase family protein
LPGFIHSPETLFKWGIIRTPVSWRIERWKSAPQQTRDLMSGRSMLRLEPSGEEGVRMIKALVGQGDLVTNVNMENNGQVSNLPVQAVVETNAHFSRDRVRPLVAGALPTGIAPLINQHCANQELIVEAALSGNTDLAFQAFFNDPTNHLPLDTAWEFFNRMLRLSPEYLLSMAIL